MNMHIPVLLNEVIKILDPKPGEFFIDGTLDGGGHAIAISEKISPNGIFLGMDWDGRMIYEFKKRISRIINYQFPIPNIILINDNFKNMKEILKNKKLGKADGLLLDLGFSSEQLENSGRGFSFLKDEPLIMTYSDKTKPAYERLKELREEELAQIIRNFGEERCADRIAKAIKKNWPIKTAKALAEIITKVVPFNYRQGRIHPATRTFQALRVFVNRELDNLKEILRDIPDFMNKGGRAAIISFHSLEDRLVKDSFRELVRKGRAENLVKKPIVPTREEIWQNPRSRSAKLRAIQII